MKIFAGIALTLTLLIPVASVLSASPSNSDKKPAKAMTAEEIYAKDCAKCHGKDGRGKTFRGKMTHARNFTDVKWQDSVTDDELDKSITDGKDKMPEFGKKLTADQIKSLVAYVRTFKGKDSK